MIPAYTELPKREVRYECWKRGELGYKLDSLQNQIKDNLNANPTATPICVLSSRQIGKSYGALTFGIEFGIKYPGTKIRFLSSTKTQVKDIVSDNMAPIIEDAPPGFIKSYRSELRWILWNGSEIRLGAMERQYVDANRGGHSHLVIYEEGGFISSLDYQYAIHSVIGPQLTRAREFTGMPGREIHISSPSEDEYHYLHEVILPKAEAQGTAFRFTIDDSPSITAEMRAECVERSNGEDTDAFRREYKAEIIRSRTLSVIPEFKEETNVEDFELPEHYMALMSIDAGGIRDKTAGLILAWDYKWARCLVWDEFLFDPNTRSSVIVKEALRLEESVKWFHVKPDRVADVPGQLQVDLINDHGYLVRLPHKDDRDAYINQIGMGFKTEKIVIHPRCKNLIGCLKVGRYNKQRTDFQRHELYGHLDPLMALVYGYRMVDKTTNPYPLITPTGDYQMRIDYKAMAQDKKLEDLANELVPYNPMQRRRR